MMGEKLKKRKENDLTSRSPAPLSLPPTYPHGLRPGREGSVFEKIMPHPNPIGRYNYPEMRKKHFYQPGSFKVGM